MAGTLLVSHIAAIELPSNNWNELIDIISNNLMIDNVNVKLSCIQTTGYICEELIRVNPDINNLINVELKNKLVNILANSLTCNQDDLLIIESLRSIFNGFDFLKDTFNSKDHRDFIIKYVLEYAQKNNEEVRNQELIVLINFVCIY